MQFFQATRRLVMTSAAKKSLIPSATASQSTYTAAQVVELGKPLELRDVTSCADSQIPNGHVRVAVHCAGLNFADILMSQGKYQEKPPLPFTPGSEFAGRVLATASDVDGFKCGDPVFGLALGAGTMAQETLVPSYFLWQAPSSASFSQTAGFVTSYGTAYGALTRQARVKAGETVLVTAAAGATGLACVDLAANVFKCKVIAACGSDAKCAVAKRRGAWQTVNYCSQDLRTVVKEMTGGDGADVIVDMVGGSLWDQCVRCVAFEGRLVVIGFASGDIPKLATNRLLLKSASAVGFYWGNYGARGHPYFMQSIADVTQLLADGRIQPYVDDRFRLEQINEAFQFVLDRKSTGKVVIRCRDDE